MQQLSSSMARISAGRALKVNEAKPRENRGGGGRGFGGRVAALAAIAIVTTTGVDPSRVGNTQ